MESETLMGRVTRRSSADRLPAMEWADQNWFPGYRLDEEFPPLRAERVVPFRSARFHGRFSGTASFYRTLPAIALA